jgi:caffeoyl-CoA O-methyltransferase
MIDPKIVNPEVLKYVLRTNPEPPVIFAKIEEQARNENRPIVSKDTGLFLHLLTKITNAKRILEIGCNIGYSGTWFATALGEDGHLDTLEISPEIAKEAEKFFKEAGVENKVKVHVGPALDTIPTLNEEYDILFIDAAKKQYKAYVELSLPKLRKGALILVDNVLWSGKVANEEIPKDDKLTNSLKEFNEYFSNHPDIETTILTIGDGIALGIKSK